MRSLALEGFDGGEDAVVFGDDVAAAAEGFLGHLGAPAGEVVHGGVAEGLDLGAVLLEDAEACFHLGAAGVVAAVAFGEGVLDHGVADDDADVWWGWARGCSRGSGSRS